MPYICEGYKNLQKFTKSVYFVPGACVSYL